MKDKKTIKLIIEGVLLGDACGVPYEFKPPRSIGFVTFKHDNKFKRAHKVPDGTWSDDGACTLALLDSLICSRGLNLEDFSKKLLDWYLKGKYQPDNFVYDIGMATLSALELLRLKVPPSKAGTRDGNKSGNGSLMRVAPIALMFDSPSKIIEAARMQSKVTHAQPEVMDACALFALWLHYEISGANNGLKDACKHFEGKFDYLLSQKIKGTGTGYYLDSLKSAVMIMRKAKNYPDAIIGAIKLGFDTDTTAAIVGAIAAARFKKLPKNWLNSLRQKRIYKEILRKL